MISLLYYIAHRLGKNRPGRCSLKKFFTHFCVNGVFAEISSYVISLRTMPSINKFLSRLKRKKIIAFKHLTMLVSRASLHSRANLPAFYNQPNSKFHNPVHLRARESVTQMCTRRSLYTSFTNDRRNADKCVYCWKN